LIIEVLKGSNKPYQYKAGFFIRIGPNTQKLRRDEILDFIVEVNKKTFDSLIDGEFDFKKDFDNRKFERYLKLAGIRKVLDNKEILGSLGVLIKNTINNAGVLFFSKNPQKLFPNSVYTVVLYKNKEGTDVIDRKEVKGSLFEIVEQIMEFIKLYTKIAYRFTGAPQREEIREYPIEAIREAVINSVMHKYYPEEGHNNLLQIFPNRIEIENYWLKPEHFVLGKTKFRRNPIITELFFRINFGEKLGSGFERMRTICREENAPFPEIEFNENYFYITFKQSREYLKMAEARDVRGELEKRWSEKWSEKWSEIGLTKRQIEILMLIKENPKISRRELSKILSINPSAVQKHLKKLKEKRVLRRIGPDRGGYWEVVEEKEK